jgi:hypothetical protein
VVFVKPVKVLAYLRLNPLPTKDLLFGIAGLHNLSPDHGFQETTRDGTSHLLHLGIMERAGVRTPRQHKSDVLQVSQSAQYRHARGSHHVLVHLRASTKARVPSEGGVALLQHPMQDLPFVNSDDK